ncbi:hypothetical protein P5673_024155 [Acropora cervicornis]|uniref:Uncharacterized protein n=1 Tax=Acropora cervicornis TaxID=6130 RepID=A0AAD9Q4C7_ACRCE|nr:hypothetical protein P5673_024155 [Acropora cervicornis]
MLIHQEKKTERALHL